MMRRLAAILLCFLLFVCADIPPQQAYIARYSDIAVKEMLRTGVPASITLAQGLVESAAGQSALAVGANNHFGIKCHSDWTGATFYHDDDRRNECFRVYSTPEESFVAHSDFLVGRSRYARLFELKPTDYKGWAKGLSEAGYATDPKYAEKLIKVIEDYDLARFDVREKPRKDREKTRTSPIQTAVPDASKPGNTDYDVSEKLVLDMVRPVLLRDGARCVTALPGETYGAIAREYNLLRAEILRYNSVKQDVALEAGALVYLEKHKGRKR